MPAAAEKSVQRVLEENECYYEFNEIPEGEEAKFEALPEEYSHLYLAKEGTLAADICNEAPLPQQAAAHKKKQKKTEKKKKKKQKK